MMRRVLFTGSRKWLDRPTVWKVLRQEAHRSPEGMIVVHGGAEGLDDIVDRWARSAKYIDLFDGPIDVEEHLPDYELYSRQRAPLVRNEEMAKSGIGIAHAFPLKGSGGTRHCMTKCYANNVEVKNHGFQPYTQQAMEYARAYG